MAGAGADIWGPADSFQFVYQPIRDGEISALVGSEEDIDPFAKTGVMIRQSLDPESPHVILDVKPEGGVEFMTRSSPGGETTFIAAASVKVREFGGNVTIYARLRLVRSRGVVTGMVCQANVCQTVGSTSWLSGPALIGVAVTSHDPSRLNHAYFPAALPTVSTVPQPWFSYDYGPVGQRGNAFFEDDTFTVSGAGADIWGMSDAFHFVSQWLVGDSEIVARVTSEQNTNPYAKAGVMMRNSQYSEGTVILDVLPNGSIEFMARAASGANMAFIAGGFMAYPVWLKLTRTGDQFTGYVSGDGGAWQQIGTTNVVMLALPYAIAGGLAVTSHDPTVLNTLTFDHVSAVDNVSR
jgi:hypothetical protein